MAMLDPNHDGRRESLRSLGMILAVAGGIMTAVGMIDFFSSMGSFSPPQYFWCAFLGLPLLGLGGSLLRFGYMGAATRYVAGEIAPVAKDTINYIGKQTKDTIVDIARAVIAENGSGGTATRGADSPAHCPKCGGENPPDALFCSECGADLRQTLRCSRCGEENAADAKFCHHCGQTLN